ncbi:hypothetical protein ACLOJK_006737 [Asimina triloba]
MSPPPIYRGGAAGFLVEFCKPVARRVRPVPTTRHHGAARRSPPAAWELSFGGEALHDPC